MQVLVRDSFACLFLKTNHPIFLWVSVVEHEINENDSSGFMKVLSFVPDTIAEIETVCGGERERIVP